MEKKTYDSTFKQEAIRLVEEQGEKTAAVAKKLGVPDLPEVIIHSGRGVQYACKSYRNL